MTTLISEIEFASMRKEWNDLLLESDNTSFFLRHEWLFNWWQLFGPGHDLYIIQVRDETGLLQAVFPLYLKTAKIAKWYLYRTLHLIGVNHAYPDYLGIIIHKNHRQNAISEIVRFLLDHEDQWDELDLESMSADDEGTISLLHQLNMNRSYLSLTWKQKIMYINLPSHWDDYFSGFKHKQRYNLKRQWRQLEEVHQGRFGQAVDKEEALQILRRMFYLHHLRADSIGRNKAFSDLRIRQMHERLIDLCFDSGMLKLYYLQASGNYEACLLGFCYKERFYFYQMGYNPDYDKISLGTTMIQKAIEQSIYEGCKIFDFLRGEEPYKRRWTKTENTIHFAKIYKKNAKGVIRYCYRLSRSKAGEIKRLPKRFFHLHKFVTIPEHEHGVLFDTLHVSAPALNRITSPVVAGIHGADHAL